MFYVAIVLIIAAFIAGYLIGWSRGNRRLARWPFAIGKGGISTRPLILFALLLVSALVACSTEHYAQPAKAPDTTAAAPADTEHHEKGKDKDKGKHPHEAKP